MGVSVAEYYGQRTDIDTPVIHPVKGQLPCPFTCGNTCKKWKPSCLFRTESGRNAMDCLL